MTNNSQCPKKTNSKRKFDAEYADYMVSVIDYWNLGFICYLDIEIWCLKTLVLVFWDFA